MTTTIQKVCSVCRADLLGQKRVKDEAGNYYCHPCWNSRHPAIAASQPSMRLTAHSPPSARATPRVVEARSPVPAEALNELAATASTEQATATGQREGSAMKSRRGKGDLVKYLVVVVVLGAGGALVAYKYHQSQTEYAYVTKTLGDAAGIHDTGVAGASQPDPAESFTKLMNRFVEKMQVRFPTTFEPHDDFRLKVAYPKDVRFNVEKTDSLLNPVIGTIRLKGMETNYGTTREMMPFNLYVDWTMTATFKSGSWQFLRLEGSEGVADSPRRDEIEHEGTQEPDRTLRDIVASKIQGCFESAATGE